MTCCEIVLWTPGRKNSPGWYVAENGCHVWTGNRGDDGYAKGWDKLLKTIRPVYVMRYEREVGPIPEGMELDHYVCDNGPGGCCNPHHCRPTTHRENTLRGDTITSRNAAKTHCAQGHRLTPDNLTRSKKQRQCRICQNAASRRWERKLKSQGINRRKRT